MNPSEEMERYMDPDELEAYLARHRIKREDLDLIEQEYEYEPREGEDDTEN